MTDPVAAVVRDMEVHTGAGVPRAKVEDVTGEQRLEDAKKRGEVYQVKDYIKATNREGQHG